MTINTLQNSIPLDKVKFWSPINTYEIIEKTSNDFQWYERKSSIKILPNITANIVDVKNTIEFYKSNHPEISEFIDFLLTKSFFNRIRAYDIVIIIDNKRILWHTYKLLSFINIYLEALILYEDGEIFENTFAKLKGDKKKYRQKENKCIRDSKEPVVAIKGAELLKASLFNLHINHNEAIHTLLNIFTLIPEHQYTIIKDEIDIKNIFFKNLLRYYGTTYTTSPSPILKSIGIFLNGYLTHYMGVPTKEAFVIINQKFFYDFLHKLSEGNYDYQVSDQSRLLKNVYITGRINMIPIFASGEKEISKETISKILNPLFEEVEDTLNIKIDFPIPDNMNPLKNPLFSFYAITPMELLQPKV